MFVSDGLRCLSATLSSASISVLLILWQSSAIYTLLGGGVVAGSSSS